MNYFQKMLRIWYLQPLLKDCELKFSIFRELCVMFCIILINHLLKKYLQLSFKHCAGMIFP